MVAAWPGIGGVALRVATYLRDELGAEELGEIEPSGFFHPAGVVVENNVIQVPEMPDASELPQSKFYFWRSNSSGNDMIIFIGDAQPPGKEWELAREVMKVAKRFKVKRLYTSAAAVATISHSQKPKVWAAATRAELIDYLRNYDVVIRDKIHISGLNGLLGVVAEETGIESICLLGEVPFYIAHIGIEYPKSAQAVLEILTKMLEVQIDMDDINEMVDEVDSKLAEVEEQIVEKMGQLVIYPEGTEETEEEMVREEIPESAKRRIEELFQEIKRDKSKAGQLKLELDRWNIFHEYEDRFLSIFRKGKDKS
jgi:hypothetical protein